nr:PREDICTED: voltage-gated potassium channel subunit beta-1-like [Struthio camelus australis]
MQVSIACTEHNLKSRNGEDRLISKQTSATPNVVSAARAKFRTVAIIARSLGTFTPQHHISLKESTAKQTGMKYRYGPGSPGVLRCSAVARLLGGGQDSPLCMSLILGGESY